jgi:hypothetical protein
MRNHATRGHGDQKTNKMEIDRERQAKASRDFEDEVNKARASHGLFPVHSNTDQPASSPDTEELSNSSTKPTFHATHSRRDLSEPLILPKLCTELGSSTQTQRTLQVALVEAASNRLARRSQVISRVMRSEAKLRTLNEALLPYRRRHPHWDYNLHAVLGFADPSQRADIDLRKAKMSPFTDDWINELYHASDTADVTKSEHPSAHGEGLHLWTWSPELRGVGQVREVRARWRRLRKSEKRMRWSHIMLRFLAVSSEQALAFLLVTDVIPFPSFESVMDVLLFLKRVRSDEINSKPQLRDQYLHILSQQRQPARWLYSIQKNHLELFLEECSDDEIKWLFEDLQSANADISYHGLLRFMDYFTKAGDVDGALKALNAIDLDIRLQSEDQLLSRCTNLLKLDSIISDGPSPNFRILPQLLEAGVKPNLVLHNLMLKNAVNLGASVVAWDLYHYLRRHDLPTDARTYMVLMKDALARRDEEALRGLLTTINTRTDLLDDPYLMTCVLTLIRVEGRKMRQQTGLVFSNMIQVYSRTFTLAPLKHLGMLGESTWSSSNQNKSNPETDTLAFVVQSYVLAQQSSMVVHSLWDRIERLRSQGDELVLALTRCLPFYDGFIVFFARRTETLTKCLQVLQLMLDRNVQPSATTWGSIALAFERNGQFQAAEDVKNMMDRQGLNIEFPPHSQRGNLHRSGGLPLAHYTPLSETELENRVKEQEFEDTVEDVTPYTELQHRSVGENQPSGTLNIGVCSSLSEQGPGYTDDVTPLHENHSTPTSPGQVHGQSADDRGHHVRGQENQKDAPIHKSPMKKLHSFEEVIAQMNEDQLNVLVQDHPLGGPGRFARVQEGNAPLPTPSNLAVSTSESRPPYDDGFCDGFVGDAHRDSCETTARNPFRVVSEGSNLVFTSLPAGTGTEVGYHLARTTEDQQITERKAEGKSTGDPGEGGAECESHDEQKQAARDQHIEDNENTVERYTTSTTKVIKAPAPLPRKSRKARRRSLPFIHSPDAILDNLMKPRLLRKRSERPAMPDEAEKRSKR